jgi:hypothetical protein
MKDLYRLSKFKDDALNCDLYFCPDIAVEIILMISVAMVHDGTWQLIHRKSCKGVADWLYCISTQKETVNHGEFCAAKCSLNIREVFSLL